MERDCLQQTTGNAEERGASEVAHTPTPWVLADDERMIVDADNLNLVATCGVSDDTNIAQELIDAYFICRACNYHDALVKALDACTQVLSGAEMSKQALIDALTLARAALAAVGKP